MAVPWLSVLNTLIDVANLAVRRKARREAEEPGSSAGAGRMLGHVRTRLTGVVLAALKEAFDRDSSRLELEREQMELERRRAQRALKLELMRQAGDREIGRLRLMAGIAFASWLGTLVFSARLIGGTVGTRVMLGAGWLFLLGALSLSFAAQSNVGRALTRIDEGNARVDDLMSGASGAAGALVPWLIVVGLAVIGLAVLIA